MAAPRANAEIPPVQVAISSGWGWRFFFVTDVHQDSALDPIGRGPSSLAHNPILTDTWTGIANIAQQDAWYICWIGGDDAVTTFCHHHQDRAVGDDSSWES